MFDLYPINGSNQSAELLLRIFIYSTSTRDYIYPRKKGVKQKKAVR